MKKNAARIICNHQNNPQLIEHNDIQPSYNSYSLLVSGLSNTFIVQLVVFQSTKIN